MTSEALYKKAFDYAKTKLWKTLWDNQLFAIEFSDNQIGYVCVMGANGTHTAIAVYIGEEGVKTYLRVMEGFRGFKSWDDVEKAFSQSCLICSYVPKNELENDEVQIIKKFLIKMEWKISSIKQFPQFQKFVPCCYPTEFKTEIDEQHMIETFDAAIEVSEKLKTRELKELNLNETSRLRGRTIPLLKRKEDGTYLWSTTLMPKNTDYDYEQAEVYNEVLYSKIKNMKPQDNTWSIGLVRVQHPIEVEKNGTLAFPLLQIILDEKTKMISDISNSSDETARNFPEVLLQTIIKLGKPNAIKLQNVRTIFFYDEFIEGLGIETIVSGRSMMFNRIRDEILQQL